MLTQNINFLAKRKITLIISSLLLLASITSLIMNGLKLGIDFTGGTLIEVRYPQAPDLNVLRTTLNNKGFSDAIVQNFGTTKDILIRTKLKENINNIQLNNQILQAINANATQVATIRRVEFVGPQVGEELTEDGGLALLYATFAILLYIAWRFEYKFSLGSVAALIHDVVITLGAFSILQMEFDLTVLAAVLAIIGYSLNDTIVVYDRIRENFRTLRKDSAENIINISLNQTLSRTLVTSITTALALIALAILGGEIIHHFAIALLIGVGIGTYSSIYVASPIVLALGISQDDLIVPIVEGKEIDYMP